MTTTSPSPPAPVAEGGSVAPATAAEQCGVSIDTLRYYEREGLIGPVARTVGGHRAYVQADLFWIGLVTCLREAGLGISDLREFTALLRSEGDPSDRVAFLLSHRDALEQRAATISAAMAVLTEKIEYYSAASQDAAPTSSRDSVGQTDPPVDASAPSTR